MKDFVQGSLLKRMRASLRNFVMTLKSMRVWERKKHDFFLNSDEYEEMSEIFYIEYESKSSNQSSEI